MTGSSNMVFSMNYPVLENLVPMIPVYEPTHQNPQFQKVLNDQFIPIL